MIRRLLGVCAGAALMGALATPAAVAQPPGLPEDGDFILRTWPGRWDLPEGVLERPTETQPNRDLHYDIISGGRPVPAPQPNVLADLPIPTFVPACMTGLNLEPMYAEREGDWLKWIIAHWAARHQPLAPEQNEGFVQPIATGVDFAYRAVQDMSRSDMPRSIAALEIAVFGPSYDAGVPCNFGDEITEDRHGIQRPADDTTEIIRSHGGYDAPVSFNFGDEATEDRGPDASETESPAPTVEILPMPHEESDITCPYLRQQTIDRHACRIADPEIGRDVLANLESLKEADNLVELAKQLARYGCLTEAMMCCDLAAKKCPGSPCSERAVDTLNELALGSIAAATDTEESAEPQPDEATEPPSPEAAPGVEPMVLDLMKACHLLMNQGMQHQAAELARQAFALDPQRVSADPLVYKMHLLAVSPPTPAGASEESEPPTCPYCPSIGKPIREILPEKKKSKDGSTTFLVPSLPPINYEVVPALEGELRLSADCSLGDNVYHLRYKHGNLTVWTTTDASKTNP